MKIYVGHSNSFDYHKELYIPIRKSNINTKHTIIFPHEFDSNPFDSKTLFTEGCDFFIAEISYPATGLGIELAWAQMMGVPIVSIYRKDKKPSGSACMISNQVCSYESVEEMIWLFQLVTRQKLKIQES
ncbi:hypothetical protein ACFVS2_25670 [Brevibacillus sp. NPDC058079]|uniref:hypothetical protein n=1 Tax=Brevibacillus sp. NPDC058079 TaxID=3346330 RepID=UPI0036ECEA90